MLANPMIQVFLLSIGLAFVIAIIQKTFTNQDQMKDMKERMNSLQDKIKKAREEDNQKELTKYNQELMKLTSGQMKMQFKPMIITMVVIVPIFIWVGPNLFGEKAIVELPFTIFGHSSLTWIWWYIIISLPMGFLFRKILGVAH